MPGRVPASEFPDRHLRGRAGQPRANRPGVAALPFDLPVIIAAEVEINTERIAASPQP
jgi:hypothetical protein